MAFTPHPRGIVCPVVGETTGGRGLAYVVTYVRELLEFGYPPWFVSLHLRYQGGFPACRRNELLGRALPGTQQRYMDEFIADQYGPYLFPRGWKWRHRQFLPSRISTSIETTLPPAGRYCASDDDFEDDHP